MIRKAVGAIVYQGDKLLIVHKTNINTGKGKQTIEGEWDFVKGGVEEEDQDLQHSILRELQEETGSIEFKIIKVLKEKICFDFPDKISNQIGFKSQETTMFLVKFFGDINSLRSIDSEISQIIFLDMDEAAEILTHRDTVNYFIKNYKEIANVKKDRT
ncbi:NUDIX hydrolase [Paucisalibacillus globulus]|uniref:NUDIX hydrolase n=1 Tax=Paucisalibacillus globulus TaxID=351095 RepID=UPI00041A982E|nr:NUDIX domain-containing protein [Paucisalibacillus globulus]